MLEITLRQELLEGAMVYEVWDYLADTSKQQASLMIAISPRAAG